jgi:hypothetical protein
MPDSRADDHPDRPLDDRELGLLQLSTLLYCLHETNPTTGSSATKPTRPRRPA